MTLVQGLAILLHGAQNRGGVFWALILACSELNKEDRASLCQSYRQSVTILCFHNLGLGFQQHMDHHRSNELAEHQGHSSVQE